MMVVKPFFGIELGHETFPRLDDVASYYCCYIEKNSIAMTILKGWRYIGLHLTVEQVMFYS